MAADAFWGIDVRRALAKLCNQRPSLFTLADFNLAMQA